VARGWGGGFFSRESKIRARNGSVCREGGVTFPGGKGELVLFEWEGGLRRDLANAP